MDTLKQDETPTWTAGTALGGHGNPRIQIEANALLVSHPHGGGMVHLNITSSKEEPLDNLAFGVMSFLSFREEYRGGI